MNKSFLFVLSLICLSHIFLFSCTPSYNSELLKISGLDFKAEKFSLNDTSENMQSKGEIRFKGEESGSADYEIFYSYPSDYRIELYGPFHISAASFIMNDIKSFVLTNSKWEEINWNFFALQNMGTDIPIEIFNIILGYRYDFEGECSPYFENKRVCRNGDIYLMINNGKVTEIMYGDFVFVHKKGVWQGESRKSVIEIENKKTSEKKNKPEIFNAVNSSGYFDDI